MFSFNSVNDSIVKEFKNFLLIQTNKIIWDNSLIIPLDNLDLKNNSFLKIECSVIIGKLALELWVVISQNICLMKYLQIKDLILQVEIPINTKSKI